MRQIPVSILIGGLIWLGLVSGGFFALMRYEHTPGAKVLDAANWPGNSYLELKKSGATLVMFVHPRCPCSRASIAELQKIMTRNKDRVAAYALFLSPGSFPAGWEKTDIWQSARRIAGLTVIKDIDGNEAKKFGPQTSGHTMVYKSNGELIYSGGITAARGQMGDNMGAKALVMSLDNGSKTTTRSNVFGCSLVNH